MGCLEGYAVVKQEEEDYKKVLEGVVREMCAAVQKRQALHAGQGAWAQPSLPDPPPVSLERLHVLLQHLQNHGHLLAAVVDVKAASINGSCCTASSFKSIIASGWITGPGK